MEAPVRKKKAPYMNFFIIFKRVGRAPELAPSPHWEKDHVKSHLLRL